MNALFVTLLAVAVLAVSVNSAALEGPTSECPDFCTYEYNPVCGYDGSCYRKYGNQCTLKADRCKSKQNLKMVDLSVCEEGLAKNSTDVKMCDVE